MPSSLVDRPLVIAHRGSSAWRPEHTLAAYAHAIAAGADAIEPDLVVTRDGVLVARHEANIADTTDVARRAAFAARRTEKVIDGIRHVGWFVEDFTLAELRQLRAIERLGALRPESRCHDGLYPVATFDEIAKLALRESRARGRAIGIVPEIKHSTYFRGLGLPIEERLIDRIAAIEPALRIEIQSFEVANLQHLRDTLRDRANITLMQLIGDADARPADVVARGGTTTYADMATARGFAAIARYADVVAPSTRALIPLDETGALGAATGFVADAHAAGLLVRPWTFRPENRFLPVDCRDRAGDDARNPGGSVEEIRRYLAAGIDGFFTDDPALGRIAVDGR